MKQNIINTKSFNFAIRIVKLSEHLRNVKNEFILSKQIMRSGTAIGSLIRESVHAESTADFIHKLSIAQKEANETSYWLELIFKTDFIDEKLYTSINSDLTELLKLLTSIIITTKKNNNIK